MSPRVKKFLAGAVVSGLCLTGVAVPAQATNHAAGTLQQTLQATPVSAYRIVSINATYETTRARVELKNSRAKGARAIHTLPKAGTRVTMIERHGSWARVRYGGSTYWAAWARFKKASSSTRINATYETTRAGVELKNSRALGARAIVTLTEPGTRVTMVERHGSWARVSYGGKTYWTAWVRFQKQGSAGVRINATYETTRARVELKNSRALGAPAIVTLPSAGTRVTMVERHGSWARVRYQGKTYWAAWARFKRAGAATTSPQPSAPPKATPTPTPRPSATAKPISGGIPAAGTYRTNRNKVRLTASRAKGAKAIHTLPQGTQVIMRKRHGSWAFVQYQGHTFWAPWAQFTATSGAGLRPSNPGFAVYGTLRKGQSAYHMLAGRTKYEEKTTIRNHGLYMRRDQTWWTFILPQNNTQGVVAEEMIIEPSVYNATLKQLDAYERFDPNKPLFGQTYNRKKVTLANGRQAWAYVASGSMQNYLSRNGIYVKSGDYLRRY